MPASAITVSCFRVTSPILSTRSVIFHHLGNCLWKFRVWSTMSTIPGLGMTFPHPTIVHYVPDESIRRSAIQMPTQLTTLLSGNELISDHQITGALTHVFKSAYCKNPQLRGECSRIHSRSATCALELPPDNR